MGDPGPADLPRRAQQPHLRGAAGQRRRNLVTAAAAAGRVHIAEGEADPALGRMDCAGFAVVTRADGTTGPWLERLGPDQLDHELRMLRAAIYIFVAGLSMMRDSEIQEIQRGSVTTHYGSPAVTSHKTKLDPARPQLRWWITEPVAQAIAVAERLSRHPTHIFATLNPPAAAAEGGIRNGRRGIDASDDIDLFIAHINTAGHRLGLQPIPAAHVRPHMFRRTMSIITGQEPDSEIALGLQLKHAARRALANAATPGYAAADTAWAANSATSSNSPPPGAWQISCTPAATATPSPPAPARHACTPDSTTSTQPSTAPRPCTPSTPTSEPRSPCSATSSPTCTSAPSTTACGTPPRPNARTPSRPASAASPRSSAPATPPVAATPPSPPPTPRPGSPKKPT